VPLYIGLISGTSVDAIDAALVDFAQGDLAHRDLAHRDLAECPPTVVAARSEPIPQALRETLLALSEGSGAGAELFALDVTLGELFAQAALALLAVAGVEARDVRAIGSHGQTVAHEPQGRAPYTVQIGDPNVIAERTGITTVADLRRRDVAAGGQGAPLVPGYHEALFRSAEVERAVANIGGIANLTVLPCDPRTPVTAFDTGPGNGLLDAWAQARLGRPFDAGGRWATEGRVQAALLESMVADPYFVWVPPKSTGRGYFNLGWVQARLAALPPMADAPMTDAPMTDADVQRTLVELTVRSVAEALERHAPRVEQVLVCGGGAHNPLLVGGLSERLAPRSVSSTAALGVDPDFVEAAAFAWLAHRTLAGLPGNLPSVTGARRPVALGGIYPGG